MSRYLDEVIKEMGNYSEMGLPPGENSMGMGTPGRSGGRVTDAYKLNSLLRNRNRAEQQEDTIDDTERNSENNPDQDYENNMDGDQDIEELKVFFMDNPTPSDEEVMQYAEEHNMDMQEMRRAVYRLIQSLLPSEEDGMDDYDSMDDENPGDNMDMDMSSNMSGDEEREISLRRRSRFSNSRRR